MRFFLLLFTLLYLPLDHAMAKTLMIGDSIFALTKAVPDYLEKSGLQLDNVSVSSAKIGEIADQYVGYIEENPVPDTVIFNGGGNDIILGNLRNCLKRNQACDIVLNHTIKTGAQMLDLMHEDGVEHVVFVGIHYLSAPFDKLNPVVDVGMEQARAVCDSSLVRCSFVDTRDFIKPNSGLLFLDGLHPNERGSRLIADAILEQL